MIADCRALAQNARMSKFAAKRPRSIDDILSDGQGRGARLRAKASRVANFNERLRPWLPTPLADHVELVALDQDRALIWADSAAWRNRLYYQLPTIKRTLNTRLGLAVTTVDTGVRPTTDRLERPRRRVVLSVTAAQTLRKAAGSFEEKSLSAALNRLADHASGAAKPVSEVTHHPSAGPDEGKKLAPHPRPRK
jgi:hypothetical protein